MRDGGFFSSIEDKFYRTIIIFLTAFSIIMLIVPLARLVPRVPIPLFTFALIYFLYRSSVIPAKVKPWLFFVILSVTYWQLQFIVNTWHEEPHGLGIIAFEKQIFGGVLPTVWLQQSLHSSEVTSWFEYLFAVCHSLLFGIPLFLAIMLFWKRDIEIMKRASVAVVFISLLGYLAYVLFPLTPPWMASLEGDIPENLPRITLNALQKITPGRMVATFQPSPRGAMPSLHAGLPLLVFLICIKEFGRKVWWLVIPILLIWFEIIYGAEHYIIDIVAGIIFAIITYIVVYKWLLPDSFIKNTAIQDVWRENEN
ncbi:MAG: inositol phosphorylceramide synthase [FCB group bacterium]|nr:inositol phosphorylceramide synthase [FCB group bacterium]